MNIDTIHRYDIIGYDTETTGLNYPIDKAFAIGIATGSNTMYIDLRKVNVKDVERELKRYRGRIVCHSAVFDAKMSKAAGISLPLEKLDCTLIRSILIDEHFPGHDLDSLVEEYLGERKISIWAELALLFGGPPTRDAQAKNLQHAPEALVSKYCKKDAALALALWEWQEEQIDKQLLQPIAKFERTVIPSIVRATMRGVRVDLQAACDAQEPLGRLIDRRQKNLDRMIGGKINVNSAPQVRNLFPVVKVDRHWELENGMYIPSTDTGAPSFRAETLRKMDDPRAQGILQIRSLIKTKGTFLQKHIIEHAVGDRVYPNINQTASDTGGTKWGRLSYTDPALQQIPARDKEVSAIVKPCFLPDKGHKWGSTDLHSFEVRMFAHFVAKFNSRIADEYATNPNLDFHQYVADETGLPRNATYAGEANAKQLNLSMIFCQGPGATAEKMGMQWDWDEFENHDGEMIRYRKPGEEAREIIERYHERIPGVKELAKREKSKIERFGYILTPFGRHCRFPDRKFAYKGSGILIQASSADVNKKNWVAAEAALAPFDAHLILNTHDGYEISAPEGREKEAVAAFKAAVEDPDHHKLRVPLILNVNGYGRNWWEALQKDSA